MGNVGTPLSKNNMGTLKLNVELKKLVYISKVYGTVSDLHIEQVCEGF